MRGYGQTSGRGDFARGVNVGDTEINYPFDPDIAPFEGQRCTVYLARL